MAATTLRVRYSNDVVAVSDAAKAFPWEAPVPVNQFWDSFDYCTARNFLGNFSEDELGQLPIKPDCSDSHDGKLQLLLRLLEAKIAQEEAASSPPQSLYETHYARWYKLWQCMYTLQDELCLPEAEQTVRMLATRRPADSGDLRPLHILANHLVRIGEYKEAEDTERRVCAWMDTLPQLGKDSPQALGARPNHCQGALGPRTVEAG